MIALEVVLLRKILQSKGKGGSSERGDYEEDKKIMRPKDKDVSSEGALTTICLSGSQRREAADTNGQRNKSERERKNALEDVDDDGGNANNDDGDEQ